MRLAPEASATNSLVTFTSTLLAPLASTIAVPVERLLASMLLAPLTSTISFEVSPERFIFDAPLVSTVTWEFLRLLTLTFEAPEA